MARSIMAGKRKILTHDKTLAKTAKNPITTPNIPSRVSSVLRIDEIQNINKSLIALTIIAPTPIYASSICHQVSKDIVVELSQGIIKIVEFIFFHLSYWQECTSPD